MTADGVSAPASAPEVEALLERARTIQAHICERDPRLVPSALWTILSKAHEEMLRSQGPQNFKRGLSQNYSTFAVGHLKHRRFRTALKAFLRRPNLAPLRMRIGERSDISNFRGENKLADPRAWRVYGLYVGLLWSQVLTGEDDLPKRLKEPEIGNPIPVRIGGKPVSQDLVTSIHEFRTIRPHLPPGGILAEIGAGYCRLGHVAHQAGGARYWVFDIAPALTVSEWYLSKLFPDRKVFRWRPFDSWEDVADEVAASDFAFFSADQLALVPPQSVDVFAAISCLHEMTKEQCALLMGQMAETARNAIYTRNWTQWHNHHDDVAFRSANLTAPAGWRAKLDRPDPIWPRFTEKLFVRNETSAG